MRVINAPPLVYENTKDVRTFSPRRSVSQPFFDRTRCRSTKNKNFTFSHDTETYFIGYLNKTFRMLVKNKQKHFPMVFCQIWKNISISGYAPLHSTALFQMRFLLKKNNAKKIMHIEHNDA